MAFPDDLELVRRELARTRTFLDSKLFNSGLYDEILTVQKQWIQLEKEMQGPFEALKAASMQFESLITAFFRQNPLPDFSEWAKTTGEGIAILRNRGWWPYPDWPASIFRTIVDMKRDGRIRSLDRMICDSYEADRASLMREAIVRWEKTPEFKERMRILKDGLWAYRKKKYGLSITSWLPQIEGVMRSFASRQGLAQGAWKRSRTQLEDAQPDHLEPFTEAFFEAFNELYDSSLPVGKQSPRKTTFPIQRDSILHGVSLKYAGRANALRIFLMLDSIHYLIQHYDEAAQEAA